MSYAYLLNRFGGSRDKVDYFCSLLEKDRVALTGSALVQVKLDVVWEDSDLDIVVALGVYGEKGLDDYRLKLIHKFTQAPLNYYVLSDRSDFHTDYHRLRDHVDSIVTLEHPDTDLPIIQLIFAKTFHLKVKSFARTFDIMNCQAYLDNVFRGGDFVYFNFNESTMCEHQEDPRAILLNFQSLEEQGLSDWMRFFRRVFKYRGPDRGMTLSRVPYLIALLLFCDRAQYRPGHLYDEYVLKSTFEAFREFPYEGATHEMEWLGDGLGADGVYIIQDQQNTNLQFIVFPELEPLYNYVNPATMCNDIGGFDNPYENSDGDGDLIFENLLGLKIVFDNKCTVYRTLEEFNKSVRFFRPCNLDPEIKALGIGSHTGQPSLCQIPLGDSGNITVPAQQLYHCIRNRSKLDMLTVVIDTNPFTTYDFTQSENTILGLSSYVSSNHCQDGSSKTVHMCRIGHKGPRVHPTRHTPHFYDYYNLKRPTIDEEGFGFGEDTGELVADDDPQPLVQEA